MEPAAEKLLNDIPANLAGGVAQPSLRPQAVVAASYDGAETAEEKQARAQGAALEIPIVREGLQFVFSKLNAPAVFEVQYLEAQGSGPSPRPPSRWGCSPSSAD